MGDFGKHLNNKKESREILDTGICIFSGNRDPGVDPEIFLIRHEGVLARQQRAISNQLGERNLEQ